MNDENEHPDELEALLPWYATGRLNAAERARVEAALAARDDLRALLGLAEEDREETVTLNELLGAPSAATWDRIAAAVAAEPRRRPLMARLAEFVGLGVEPNRGRLAWAGAAAALVIVLQGGALVAMLPSEVAHNDLNPRYGTASAPAAPSNGAQLLIAFAPDARVDQLAAFLAERHGTIVEGPRSGLYKVRFGDKPLPKAETDALIQAVRASPIVKMALPAGG